MCFIVSSAPTAVTGLQVKAMASTVLNVSWDLPQFPNGPLSHYRLYYREYRGEDPPSLDITSGYTMKIIDHSEVWLVSHPLILTVCVFVGILHH